MTAGLPTKSSNRFVLRFLLLFCIIAMPSWRAHAQARAHANVGLQPGDKVELKIWREPDLSGEFEVSAEGIVVLPKIGRVDVDNLSTDSLRAFLMTRYSGSLRDPAIEVTVLRRVNVVGSVRNPGFYYGDPTVTINGAVALAGGVTPDGNANRLELIHRGAREPTRFSRQSPLADAPIQSGDQVRVPQRSWLSRNTGFVGGGLSAVAILIAAIIR